MQKTILATDLDGTFLGGSEAQRAELYDWINARRDEIVLIYASGRSLTAMQDVLTGLPLQPDHIIADVGTSFYTGPQYLPHDGMEAWFDGCWATDARERIHAVLQDYDAPANGIFAVFPQRKHLPLRVRLWIDFLKHSYGQPEFWAAPRPESQ